MWLLIHTTNSVVGVDSIIIHQPLSQTQETRCIIDDTLHVSPWWYTPKVNQANYMKKSGIQVPRIFQSIDSWLNWLVEQPKWKWHGIYLRSEHPRDGEVNARSGILDSLQISYLSEIWTDDPHFYISGLWSFLDRQTLLDDIHWAYHENQKKKCEKSWYDISKLSFSIWEYIPGDNYTVVADKNLPWYFFIHPISVTDRGIRTKRIPEAHADNREKKLIDLYKSIQVTNKFGSTPIIEMQLKYDYSWEWDNILKTEWEPYFLQALQTYDGTHSDWSLDREREPDEQEADFVRWVTPKEGIEVDIEIIPPWAYHRSADLSQEWDTVVKYDGFSIDTYAYSQEGRIQKFVERIVSNKDEQICIVWFDKNSGYSWEQDNFLDMLTMHAGVSVLHKPKLTLVIPNHILYTWWGVRESYLVDEDHTYWFWSVRIRITSDGKKAFFKVLNQ